ESNRASPPLVSVILRKPRERIRSLYRDSASSDGYARMMRSTDGSFSKAARDHSTNGRPTRSANCLDVAAPNREPFPPAAIIAAFIRAHILPERLADVTPHFTAAKRDGSVTTDTHR